MKKSLLFITGALLVISLSACSNGSAKVENAQIKLSTNALDLTTWNSNGSHLTTVKGNLLSGDKPIEGAVVKLGNSHEKTTDKDGSFDFTVDSSKLNVHDLTVASAENAKINGKSVSKEDQSKLVGVRKDIAVRYPVIIDSVNANSEDATLVDVKAHAKLNDDQGIPRFRLDKYKVSGTIKDADGKPVSGAIVNIRYGGVEGFVFSPPSDKDGHYEFFFIPSDDGETYFYVVLNGVRYSLPDKRVYMFPEDTSAQIDVTLPKTGTVIDDKPPTLVTKTALGAHYSGLLFGLNLPDNVKYSVSVPNDEDGSFTVTLPKAEWDKNPTFFETTFEGFMEDEVEEGDMIPSTILSKPSEKDPTGIVATKK